MIRAIEALILLMTATHLVPVTAQEAMEPVDPRQRQRELDEAWGDAERRLADRVRAVTDGQVAGRQPSDADLRELYLAVVLVEQCQRTANAHRRHYAVGTEPTTTRDEDGGDLQALLVRFDSRRRGAGYLDALWRRAAEESARGLALPAMDGDREAGR